MMMTSEDMQYRKEIVEMARQAGMALENYGGTLLVRHLPSDSLEAFAKLVDAKATAREREACAKLADEMTMPDWVNEQIAKAIRARGTHECS